MAAAAHSPEFAKKAGVPQSVAREFNEADSGGSKPPKKKRAPAWNGRSSRKYTSA